MKKIITLSAATLILGLSTVHSVAMVVGINPTVENPPYSGIENASHEESNKGQEGKSDKGSSPEETKIEKDSDRY